MDKSLDSSCPAGIYTPMLSMRSRLASSNLAFKVMPSTVLSARMTTLRGAELAARGTGLQLQVFNASTSGGDRCGRAPTSSLPKPERR